MSEDDASRAGKRRRRRTAKEHGPDPIDRHVGQQLRIARGLAGLTQNDIARRLGIRFQVVQKYEHGEIRVSASRLHQFALLLARPVDYFFAGFTGDVPPGAALGRREIELLRAFRLIASPALREALHRLLRELAETPGDDA